MEYSIKELIPQREPLLMVDELLDVADGSGTSVFKVTKDNILVSEGVLSEAGIIENMAQTAAAVTGYHHLREGALRPPLGMIGELRDFVLHSCPKVGDSLRTIVSKGITAYGVSVVRATMYVDDAVVAESTLKIFIEEDDD